MHTLQVFPRTKSDAVGKMVVLDEAYKYMLDNPRSKVLTKSLETLIRLQCHKGTRVIISTQEPTISTDLIALWSVTIIHRFTSPAWYAALKKHIYAMDSDTTIMQQIEDLETGEALDYCPNAVLDLSDDGSATKAIGRLLRLNVGGGSQGIMVGPSWRTRCLDDVHTRGRC